ncbi:hypothetical protein PGTUg99_007252 [Puccinia graminis f. sp. tritici]|uniref:Uncharacterized protein n=1 Tax=Puccinia graminis f. sp. tritici TaxID=56615 RepID=A0A5B0QG47_PUCGR|nr:hypothetical protein PGTUg99_007252 [Puccinia graminis f. sp. tritici]
MNLIMVLNIAPSLQAPVQARGDGEDEEGMQSNGVRQAKSSDAPQYHMFVRRSSSRSQDNAG